jgi:hypothetical protein
MGQLRTCQNGKKDIHHVFLNGFPLKIPPFPGGKSSASSTSRFRGDLGDAGELDVLESGLSPSFGKEKPRKAAAAVVEFIGS